MKATLEDGGRAAAKAEAEKRARELDVRKKALDDRERDLDQRAVALDREATLLQVAEEKNRLRTARIKALVEGPVAA